MKSLKKELILYETTPPFFSSIWERLTALTLVIDSKDLQSMHLMLVKDMNDNS